MAASSRLTRKARRLARVAGQLVEVCEERLNLIYERVLAVAGDGEHSPLGPSGLNNDGTPLQLVLVSSQSSFDVRLIGDPCTFLGAGENRLHGSIEALRRILAENNVADFSKLSEESLLTVLPATPEARASYANGFVWLALSLRRPGIGFYLEAGPLGQAPGWEAALELLRKVTMAPPKTVELIEGLKTKTRVASVGVEGTNHANSRLKIYFRLAQPTSLPELGVDLFTARETGRFLEMAMGDSGLELDGLVMCLGINLTDGQLADCKIDLCGHCLTYSNQRWVEIVRDCVTEFGLASMPLERALETRDCRVAFIGFRISTAGERWLNIYLQGCDREDTPVDDEARAALEDGIQYLCRLQHDDGKWTDFQLPVGASDQWVTAYTGLALAQMGKSLRHDGALKAARQSAAWLLGNQHYDAGWGYNARVGPDTDSTAICLNLLKELGIGVRTADQDFLRQHWHVEGGFSTYRQDNAWGRPHWDVTPLAYLSLAEKDKHELRSQFLQALNDNRMAGNMWRSYWWRRPFYSTFITLETLDKLQISESGWPPLDRAGAQLAIDNSFDLACFIGIEILRGASREQLGPHVRTLLKWQKRSGSWPGEANLRVTDRGCYAPWQSPSGAYFSDEAGTITTATVIRVLTRYLNVR
jgi:hypothetical protein